jgi:hypothetical protein
VKILCDNTYGELLGAHLVGSEVTVLLPELTLAQQWDLGVHEIARNVHAHPTLGEEVQEAIHGLAGHDQPLVSWQLIARRGSQSRAANSRKGARAPCTNLGGP